MGSISSSEIISILKEEIENYDLDTGDQEIGQVIWVGDGIATIYGMDQAMYGEIVIFENGVKGMVQDVRKNEIGCILFGSDTGIREGTKVTRTKKRAGIPVGEAFIGRVIDPLGAPIDGKGAIASEDYRPIENEAPGIIDRKSVGVPLETALRMASQNPARFLGIQEETGSIREGKRADLMFVDDRFICHRTYVGGRVVFDRSVDTGERIFNQEAMKRRIK